MDDIQLKLNEHGKGSFFVKDSDEVLAEMELSVLNGNLIVYHTQVSEKLRGLGIATKLLSKMVDYARTNKLKVVPLCPYVLAQFKRHPEQYTDIWNKNWHQ